MTKIKYLIFDGCYLIGEYQRRPFSDHEHNRAFAKENGIGKYETALTKAKQTPNAYKIFLYVFKENEQ